MRGGYERERRKTKEKDHWSVAAHALKRTIKCAADAATKPRISDVDRASASYKKIAAITILSIALSFSSFYLFSLSFVALL